MQCARIRIPRTLRYVRQERLCGIARRRSLPLNVEAAVCAVFDSLRRNGERYQPFQRRDALFDLSYLRLQIVQGIYNSHPLIFPDVQIDHGSLNMRVP